MESTESIILGAGLAGLSAGYHLQSRATVLEKDSRVGGLVKTVNYNGYWFDHVLHLLHFQSFPIQDTILDLLGSDIYPIDPEAWVETSQGTSRYPLQMNLKGQSQEAITQTIADLKTAINQTPKLKASNFEEMLEFSFGKYFCELFMFPYNRKVWKRPLKDLAPSGFQWNIDHPDLDKVIEGSIAENTTFVPYNSNGWYPRPPVDSTIRGMEVLAKSLGDKLDTVRLHHTIVSLSLQDQTVICDTPGGRRTYHYDQSLLSTIPLPTLLQITTDLPQEYVEMSKVLMANRVITVMLSIKGPRPEGRGHWRYYGEESVIFTRLVYLHNFDPMLAPDDGWGLLMEITEPSEWPMKPEEAIYERVLADLDRVSAIPQDCTIIDQNLLVVNPAYVVFTNESKITVQQLKEYYATHKVTLLGRYGQWEYSSMAQVMNDGFQWAKSQDNL